MKKKKLILATSIGIFVVIGSLVAVLVLLPGLGTSASSNAAAQGSASSGAIVIAWNQELLHIVQTPGAQPATVHPTRSFAILHAAIYDAIVSITRDAPPYAFSVSAPSGARADAAAAVAGHDTLAALYPKMKAALDHLLASELRSEERRVGKERSSRASREDYH